MPRTTTTVGPTKPAPLGGRPRFSEGRYSRHQVHGSPKLLPLGASNIPHTELGFAPLNSLPASRSVFKLRGGGTIEKACVYDAQSTGSQQSLAPSESAFPHASLLQARNELLHPRPDPIVRIKVQHPEVSWASPCPPDLWT